MSSLEMWMSKAMMMVVFDFSEAVHIELHLKIFTCLMND